MQKKPPSPVKKVASPLAPQVHAPSASVPQPVLTEANKIWNDIKGVQLQLFGLPNQTVAQFCTPVPVEPSRLFVVIKNSATLPALETALAGKYTVELADKFVIVAPIVAGHINVPKK